MTLLFLLIKPILFMMVRKVFKKQFKVFAVELLEDYAQSKEEC